MLSIHSIAEHGRLLFPSLSHEAKYTGRNDSALSLSTPYIDRYRAIAYTRGKCRGGTLEIRILPMRKMSQIIVDRIVELHKKGVSERAIALEVGWSRSAVWYQLRKALKAQQA